MSQIIKSNDQYILFDPNYCSSDECAEIFSVDSVPDKVSKTGRGEAIFFRYGAYEMVAKHYLRGGLLSHFVHDQYFACDVEATRAFKEWHLLGKMRALGLPVPKPVAARVLIQGCFYRADLVTEKINLAKTLAEKLTEVSLGYEAWQAVGVLIKRFHQLGVYHADLNANNIIINEQQELFLLDFDKGQIKLGEAWKINNIERLLRSLLKGKKKETQFNFEMTDWQQLLKGYSAT
ncbi:MAG: 3-deoxy-D-manno-octulosonic acid kinase [Gammaproteobacteria bacterium]|nr:3-deoxy-D-manno-octulosonic acid kinase [Gammaproteobacteria bacterium]